MTGALWCDVTEIGDIDIQRNGLTMEDLMLWLPKCFLPTELIIIPLK